MNTASPRESSIERASAREVYPTQIGAQDAELAKNRAAAKTLLDDAACNYDPNVVNTKAVEAFKVASDLAQQARAAELDAKKRLCTLEASAVRENLKREEGRDAEHRGEPPRALAAVVSTSLARDVARSRGRATRRPPSPMETLIRREVHRLNIRDAERKA
jgi:hypothetical protein